jgi:hypothetical protein
VERQAHVIAALALVTSTSGHAQTSDPGTASCPLESPAYNQCEQERAIRLRIQALELYKDGKYQKEPHALRCDQSKQLAKECLTAVAAFHKTKAMLLQHEMNENRRRAKELFPTK